MDEVLDRLIEIGRRQGGSLTLGQVAAELPVDEMPMGELAMALERLEAAGVTVDVDPELMGPARGGFGEAAEPLPDLPPANDPAPPAMPSAPLGGGTARAGGGGLPKPGQAGAAAGAGRGWVWPVLALVAVLAVLGLVLA